MSKEELLVLLIEECGEVIQAATKCLRFGYNHIEHGYGLNSDVLSKELGEVQAIVDVLSINEIAYREARAGKLQRAIALKERVLNEQSQNTNR